MKKTNFIKLRTITWMACLIILLLSTNRLFSATDKYRLVVTGDPSKEITIGWNQISGTDPTVYYDTIDHGTDYSLYAFSKTVDREVTYRGMENRFVKLTDLIPGKSYYFVIKDSDNTSDRYWFKTAPNDLSRLSVIAGGDSRTNRNPRQRANLLVSKLKPHVVLFGGDFTDDDTDEQWQNWMDDWQLTIANDGRMFPIIPAQGNHESHAVVYNLFNTPSESYYYATTFGDDFFRVYTLNTEVSVSGNQLNWLKNDLNENPDIMWKLAQYHKPIRPHYAHKAENEAAYDAWAQLFYDNNVRLIIESDAHVVKETWPIEPSSLPGNDEGFIINETYGCVYVGEGGWGAPLYDNDDDKSWTRNSGKFYQFKLFFIDDTKVEIRTIKTDNADEVGEVSNDDPFTLPDNLDVWNPSNGPVVEVLPAPTMNKPDIEFADNTPIVYVDGENLTLEIQVINEGNGIDSVTFYIDGNLEEVITTPPYTFMHSYEDGKYTIDAVAYDTESLTDQTSLTISVGTFIENGEVPVKNGQDDVEETQAGLTYFNSSDLEMVYDHYEFDPDVPNGFQKIGLRFQNVFIPPGAIIDSAFLQFRSDEINDEFAEFLIKAENTDNAIPFDDGGSSSVSGRTTFNETVYWAPPAWMEKGVVGPEQKTSDMGELLQKIINRDDWISGNDMVFIVEGTGVSLTDENAKRVADSYEGKQTHPPTLVYTFYFDAESVVGINKKVLKGDSYVYPNPFNNTCHIHVSDVKDQIVNVQLFDIVGKLVFSEKEQLNNGKLTLNLNLQMKGVYLIRILTASDKVIMQQKVIKQ
jgi:hypothetical protein